MCGPCQLKLNSRNGSEMLVGRKTRWRFQTTTALHCKEHNTIIDTVAYHIIDSYHVTDPVPVLLDRNELPINPVSNPAQQRLFKLLNSYIYIYSIWGIEEQSMTRKNDKKTKQSCTIFRSLNNPQLKKKKNY